MCKSYGSKVSPMLYINGRDVLPLKGSSPRGEPLSSAMLTETAGSALCEAVDGVELGDFPIMLIILTRRLLDFVGVDVSVVDVSTLGVDVVVVVAVAVAIDADVVVVTFEASSFLTVGVLVDLSRKLNAKRRFSFGLCSSDRLTFDADDVRGPAG